MQIFLQLLIGGVLQGGIYALGAFGLSIIFGVLRVLNVAHGDYLMLGGMATYWLYTTWAVPPFLAVLIVFPIFFVGGLLVERIFIRPITGMAHHEFLVASILITLGISLAIEDVTAAALIQPIKGIDYFLPPFRIGTIVISSLRLSLLGLIVALTAGIHLFLRRSFMGKALRAVMEDREGAMLAGIDIGTASMVAFGLGTALTATAGVFFVTLIPVDPHIGIPLTLRYLAIIVLGGVGNLPGALAGSVVLGLSESIVSFYVGAEWSLTVAFLILIAILLLRPRGLFG
ncbi:MAG TPA: branched-chain amino acid ABC transporter permease [Methylomirabilota bacterium]|nr:branched-chain amino acid ABC transporter permease [Methylomirabilota bacterium]